MPVALCSPRPQFAVSAPTPAGEKGAVQHVVAALGHLLAVSSTSFRARTIASVMTPMAREIVDWDTPSCSPITACITL